MSLRRASAVISEYSNSNHGTKLFRIDKSGLNISSKALTGDRKSIENIFREHRSVAHILAALAALADHRKPSARLVGNISVDHHFLSTVLYYQERLSKAENFDQWNLWWIEVGSNPEGVGLPEPWLPKQETMEKIFQPWIDAGRPIE